MEWVHGILLVICIVVVIWLPPGGAHVAAPPLPSSRRRGAAPPARHAPYAAGAGRRPGHATDGALAADWPVRVAGDPIDLLPEFLPGIGPLDDIVVAALVLRFVARRLGRDYLRAHWPGNDDGFAMVERLL